MHKDIFDIKSIALVGASANPAKLGYHVLKNIKDYGFDGNIYPVNLTETQILNIRSFPNLIAITDQIDLVIVAIPSSGVLEIVQTCIDKFVPLVCIITAGFKEIGGEGIINEEKIKLLIKNTSTRIIGPNCLGFIDASKKINASFAANFPPEFNISFISQSGALGTAFLDWSNENNLGIHQFVSIGNKADIDENYFLEKLQNEKVIALYLEDIKDGKKLMKLGYQYNKVRPVIILKPGRSEAAAKAISSHTGSLAGGHKIISTALKQSGYIEVTTIGDLFQSIKAFAWQPILKDNKIAIVTNAGGPAVITTDLLVDKGLELAAITEETARILQKSLPRTANIHNPIDVIGDALSSRYEAAMDAVLQEDEVSALIVLLTPQIMTEIEKTAILIGQMQKYKKPILVSFIGGTVVEKGIELLNKEHVPAYPFPETVVSILSLMLQYRNYLNTSTPEYTQFEGKSRYYRENHLLIHEIHQKTIGRKENLLTPEDAETIAKMYGIFVPESFLCASVEEAILHVKNIQYPVILKLASPYLAHKSDIGGVITDITNEEKLRESFLALSAIIQNHEIVEATIEIQPFITKGIQLLVGTNKDPNFGTTILFGEGDIYAEIRKDVAQRILPINETEIEELINETIIAQILNGARGHAKYPIDKIKQTILSLQDLVSDYSFIKSIDINPLIVTDDEVYAVDIKIFI